ncbi:hypothetical protein, conserved [Eimeria brunetti]|uniref:Uncharacterized protein n=1 Tax=Eimeria brunetti TaxID=51314 RepID=U6LJX4_9EIME|nr:hypothetical protein, conserved [Eimeria brunetti]
MGLLRNIYSTGRAPGRNGDQTKLVPFVVTVGRPLQRLAVRELLGCDKDSLDNVEEWEDIAMDVAESKGAKNAPKGVAEPSWRQLCAATSMLHTFIAFSGEVSFNPRNVGALRESAGRDNSGHCTMMPLRVSSSDIGLERLRSGAVLLTVELPSTIHDEGNNRASTREGIASAQQTQKLRAPGTPPAPDAAMHTPIAATKGETGERTEPLGELSEGVCTLTEAALVQAVALTLVETADILVIPLLYGGTVSTSRSQGSRESHEFGELLCVQRIAREAEESQGTKPGTSHTGDKYRSEPKLVTAQVCLPKDVSHLLQTMRQLIDDAALHDEASSSPRQSRIHPKASPGAVSSGSSRRRRFPHIVIAVEGPVSQSRREAIRTEIRAQLCSSEGKRNPMKISYCEGQARNKCTGAYVNCIVWDKCDVVAAARVSVVSVQPPGGGKDARIEMDLLIQGIEPRNVSMTQIADALVALLTRQHITGPPNTFEFAAHALSTIACAAACRLSLADAREGLRRLQRPHPQNVARQPLGSLAQGILSEALTRYDYRTRRYQVRFRQMQMNEADLRVAAWVAPVDVHE